MGEKNRYAAEHLTVQSVLCFCFQSLLGHKQVSCWKVSLLREMKAALVPQKNLVNLVKEAIKRNNRLAYKFSESLLLPCRTQWKQLAGWEIEGRRTLTCAIVEAFVKFHLTSPLQIWGGGGATYTSFWDVWTENSMLTSYCLLSPHSQNS